MEPDLGRPHALGPPDPAVGESGSFGVALRFAAVGESRLPNPRDILAGYTAASSALWMVTPNQASIRKRNPSNLSIQSTLKVSGFTGGSAQSVWLTYGLDFLWLSTQTPNDDGAIAKVSPPPAWCRAR